MNKNKFDNRSIFIINYDCNYLQAMKNEILEDNALCQLIIKKNNSILLTFELEFGVKIYLATYENSKKFLRGKRPFMILHDPDLEEIKRALLKIYTMIKEVINNGN